MARRRDRWSMVPSLSPPAPPKRPSLKGSGCLALVSAFCLALPLFAPRFFPLPWFGLIPLLIALETPRWKEALKVSFLFGVAFHSMTNYWIIPTVARLGPFVSVPEGAMKGWAILALLGVTLWESLFAALFGSLAWAVMLRHRDTLGAFAIGSAWLLSEWLRSLGTLGYPWGLLASTQVGSLPVLQSVAWVGSYGLGGVLATVNALLLFGFRRPRFRMVLLAGALLTALIGFGSIELQRWKRQLQRTPRVTVAAVQGNFGLQRWLPDVSEKKLRDILTTHLNLSEEAVREGAKIIVWSETALPFPLRVKKQWTEWVKPLTAFVKKHRVALLVGASEGVNDGHNYNACFAFAPYCEGKEKACGVYRKVRLVPFGEYLPWQRQFPWLRRWLPHQTPETKPGARPLSPLRLWLGEHFFLPVAVAICFESLFPSHLRTLLTPPMASLSADLLVIITNDSWFGKTLAPYHHARSGLLRAVEARRSLIRCASTGISLIALPTGEVIRQSRWDERTVLVAPVPLVTTLSPYHRIGDLPLVSLATLWLIGALMTGTRQPWR